MGKPARELAVIHVSLAATYTDLRQYSKAVEHYRQELALRQGSSSEVYTTTCSFTLHYSIVWLGEYYQGVTGMSKNTKKHILQILAE